MDREEFLVLSVAYSYVHDQVKTDNAIRERQRKYVKSGIEKLMRKNGMEYDKAMYEWKARTDDKSVVQ